MPNLCLECTDRDIRPLLKDFIASRDRSSPDAILLEEFALWGGTVRADFAALGVISHGYEIKSAKDTLKRFKNQKSAYNDVFDRITLVSVDRHLQMARLPAWWGIVKVEEHDQNLTLTRIKEAQENPRRNPIAIASLLWRQEALDLLSTFGLDTGLRRKPTSALVERLVAEFPVNVLSQHVREAIRARGDWKFAARRKRYDDRFLHSANSWCCPRMPYARKRQ